MRLENKITLVTAAASGMGRAGVIRFAAEGSKVAAVDVNEKSLNTVIQKITDAGHDAIGICADLTDDGECARIVTDTVKHFGGLDLLWNNVGHTGFYRVEGIDPDDYAITMDLNVRSVFMTTGAAIPEMRSRGGGSILFTSSIAGLVGSPSSPVYAAAKWGVNGLMASLAGRLAADNIRVNSVCPGPVDTPMLHSGRSDQETDAQADLATLKSLVPLQRVGTPEEIVNTALFLLSDEASYITGVALPVDGGFSSK